MENTSQKSSPAIEFSSGFCDSDFKMKIGGTVYEISTHFDPEGSRCVFCLLYTSPSPRDTR